MNTIDVAKHHVPSDTPVIGPAMTSEQFIREQNYRVAMSIVKSLQNNGLLTQREYRRIDTKMAQKFSPVWGDL